MSVSAAQLLLSPLFLAAGLWAWKWLSWRRRNPAGLPMPPGPKGYPIIGNVLDMPQKATWLTFREWAKQYGDIVSVDILGTKVVIMNTAKPAYDTFEKRGAIYSDRPRCVLLSLQAMQTPDSPIWHRMIFLKELCVTCAKPTIRTGIASGVPPTLQPKRSLAVSSRTDQARQSNAEQAARKS